MGFADHVKEIERVGQDSNTGRDAIVVESWRRCLDTYQLDPAQAREAVIVSQTRLREHRQQSVIAGVLQVGFEQPDLSVEPY